MNFQPLHLVSITGDQEGPQETQVDEESVKLSKSIGRVLRDLRKSRKLSLNDLAKVSGVSRSMLSQMESARSTPSVAVLYKVAKAFDVSISAFLHAPELDEPVLLARDEIPLKISAKGKCAWRSLIPQGSPLRIEFYEITLGAGGIEELGDYPAGAWCNLTVAEGSLVVAVRSRRYRLNVGDAFQFAASVPFSLVNTGTVSSLSYLIVRQSDPHAVPLNQPN